MSKAVLISIRPKWCELIAAEPKKLSEFVTGASVFTYNKDGNIVYSGMKRPPQSWCYVEELP